MGEGTYCMRPIGVVESPLRDRADAPRQGDEGAPDADVVLDPWAAPAAADIRVGDELVLVTWLDRASRDVLRVRPRGDPSRPETGVFSTRSPDRPNPLGLHTVPVLAVDRAGDSGPEGARVRVRVRGLEALDGTPVVDIKPVLRPTNER